MSQNDHDNNHYNNNLFDFKDLEVVTYLLSKNSNNIFCNILDYGACQ